MVSIGSQFSVGEQREDQRMQFWASGFSKCQNPSCPSLNTPADKHGNHHQPSWARKKKDSIRSEGHPAGCRMNGDGYGTTVFTCVDCDWKTSFQYDEASEPYYYETRFWDRNPTPAPPPHPWAKVDVFLWLRSIQMDPRIISKCREFGLLHGPSLSDMSKQKLLALSFSKQEADLLLEEIQKKELELSSTLK